MLRRMLAAVGTGAVGRFNANVKDRSGSSGHVADLLSQCASLNRDSSDHRWAEGNRAAAAGGFDNPTSARDAPDELCISPPRPEARPGEPMSPAGNGRANVIGNRPSLVPSGLGS